MADWAIVPLSESRSQEAGALVRRILEEEFSQALTLCEDADLDDMAGAYGGTGRAAWVALSDGHVVGTVAVNETPDGSANVKRFYVEKRCRGRGVGKALHDVADAWIEREGYQHVVLTTTEPMSAAREFYRRRGYQEVSRALAPATTLRHFARALGARPFGTRMEVDSVPSHRPGEIEVIVERPRGYVEGWHWDGAARQLVLTECYDRAVPVNYGLAPEWINGADGDALDVIVLDDRRMRPGEAFAGRSVGVLWRADGDHKLLVEPTGGAHRPVALDKAYRERVSSWWDAEHQPIGWDGPEGVPRLMAQCRNAP